MSRLSLPVGLALAALTLTSVRPAAAITTIAQDSADDSAYGGPSNSNISGTINGNNGGTGFNAFSLVNNPNNVNGSFIAHGSPIGSGTYSNAFNLFNSSSIISIDATRSFTTPLAVGSTFSTDFRNTGITGPLGFVAYTLRDTTGTTLFKFDFIGGQNDYFYGDGTTRADTGLFYTQGGLHTSLTLTTPMTYSFSVQRLGDASPSTFTGTLGTGGAIDRVVFTDNGNGDNSDTQFNNLKITAPNVAAAPEPSQMAALAICALGLGGLMLARRRQNMRLA